MTPTPTPERAEQARSDEKNKEKQRLDNATANLIDSGFTGTPNVSAPESRLREEWDKYWAYLMSAPMALRPKAGADFWLSKLSQERERWLSEVCERCGCTREKWSKKGILCDFKISNGAHTFQAPFSIPSGVSQWLEYGKKFGYDKFFLGKERERIAGEIEEYLEKSELQPHFPNGATNFVKKGRIEAMEFVLALLKSKN